MNRSVPKVDGDLAVNTNVLVITKDTVIASMVVARAPLDFTAKIANTNARPDFMESVVLAFAIA